MVTLGLSAKGQMPKRYIIGRSGCSVSLYCDPGKAEENSTPDSSIIYTAECTAGDVTWDVICVRLSAPAPGLTTAAQVLEQYLDHLRSSYGIVKADGYTRDLQLHKDPKMPGIRDQWLDKDNNIMKIHGWTNGRYVAVLIASSLKPLPEAKVKAFADSFTFPAK